MKLFILPSDDVVGRLIEVNLFNTSEIYSHIHSLASEPYSLGVEQLTEFSWVDRKEVYGNVEYHVHKQSYWHVMFDLSRWL